MLNNKTIENQQYFTTGAKKDKKDRRDFQACSVISPIGDYPSSFELKEKFEPKMQWSRGSCTNQAFAHHKERQEDIPLSARFGMASVKTNIEHNTNYGGYTRNAFKSGKDVGIAEESLYPEPNSSMSWKEYVNADLIPQDVEVNALEHKLQSYWSVNRQLNNIKDILLTGKSVVISMAWYSVFNRPDENGILPVFNKSDNYSGHAVEIVGWNDTTELLKIKNSWSKSWGKNGYFYMPYSYIDDVVWDLWTSLDIPKNVPVDEMYGNNYQKIDMWRDIFISAKVLLKYKRLPTRRELNALLNYWDYETVFEGKNGDVWLYHTKIEAEQKNLI